MSMLFRAVKETDVNAIHALALKSGIGITTLPKDRSTLEARVNKAIQAFAQTISAPRQEYYLFVLEDVVHNRVVGTAAIESLTGQDTPFYAYRHVKEKKSHAPLEISVVHEYLVLTFENQHKSEICTLYLDPEYRHSGNGLLLSLARFLFMYHFPERFADTVIAELRGVAIEGQSPFWNAVGQHFFHMPFSDADERTISTNKRFIADLIPTHPIYINSLPDEAKKVIGVADPVSQAAMNILLQQGFKPNETVDIFDAGPTLEVERTHIRTIQNTQQYIVNIASYEHLPTERVLMSNASLAFKATLGTAAFDSTQHLCFIDEATARLLTLRNGEQITISEI